MAENEDTVPNRLEPEQTTDPTRRQSPAASSEIPVTRPRRIFTRSRRNSAPLLELGVNNLPIEQNRTQHSDDQTVMSYQMDPSNQSGSENNGSQPEQPPVNESQSRIVITTAPVPQIPRLTSLKPEEVISFLHSFDSARDMCSRNGGQSMMIKAYIDGGVVRELNEVYRAVTTQEVRAVLDKIVEDYDVNKQEDGFIILREQLSWPKNEPTLDRSVTKYFQDIRRIMSKEDFTQNKQRMKQVVKEAIKHLPKFFNLDPTDYMNLQTLIEAGQRKFLPKEQFEAIKIQQKAKRESGQQDSLLDQLEQFLRMRAWANRDLQSTKQQLTSVLNVSSPVAPPQSPILPQQHPQHAHLANQPPTSTVPQETSGDRNNHLIQAMTNLTGSLEAMALRNNRQGPGPCFCCGSTNHTFRQCDVWKTYLRQTGQSHLIQNQQQRPYRQFNFNRQAQRQANIPQNFMEVLQALQPSPQPVVQSPPQPSAQFPPFSPVSSTDVQILQAPQRQQYQQQQQQPQFNQRRYQQIPPMRSPRDPNRAMDIRVKLNMQQLSKRQATIEVFGSDWQWHPQKGCLDSGATMTVGSVQLHEKFCTQVEVMRKLRDVVLPDGTRVKVLKQARIWLRAKHPDGRVNVFSNIKIALVDSPQWEWLLIGWTDLYHANATPEQALYSNSVPSTAPMDTKPAILQHINQNLGSK